MHEAVKKRAAEAARQVTTELEIGLYIFMLAGFLGYHVITRVPPLLHTPLMSATNAMSGISLVGSLVVAGSDHSPLSTAFGLVAVACSSTNVVGGFLITDRMLKMFKTEKQQAEERAGFRLGPRTTVALVAAVLLALALVGAWPRVEASLHGADFTPGASSSPTSSPPRSSSSASRDSARPSTRAAGCSWPSWAWSWPWSARSSTTTS